MPSTGKRSRRWANSSLENIVAGALEQPDVIVGSRVALQASRDDRRANLDFFEPVIGPQPAPEVLSRGDEVRFAQLADRDEAQVHRGWPSPTLRAATAGSVRRDR